MGFSTKKTAPQYGVLFEIGSGSVAGAIVSSNSTLENPVILYAVREFLSLKQTKIPEDITKRLLGIFMSTALDVESKLSQFLPKGSQPSALYINFTAPWAHSRGSVHTYENEKPFFVTDGLLQKIREIATEKVSDETSTVPVIAENEYTIINRAIVGYTANNYPIDSPIGQLVEKISATETISAVDNTLFIPVSDMVIKIFPNTSTRFCTSPLVQQHILGTNVQTPSTFATIHLTYEALELCLYRDREIISAFTTPIGVNTIARNIATLTKIPHEQVLSFLTCDDVSLYKDSITEKIKKAFTSDILLPLANFFAKTHASELLPHDFFLITTLTPSPTLEQFIAEVLTKATKKFSLTKLYIPIIHSTSGANLGSNDLGICTLAHFFHNTTRNS